MIDLSWAAKFLPLTGAGFGVGFLVGLTGVGGGALMTPLLISTFGVSPQVAVGTDLLYAAVTKTAGSWRHHLSDHVDWPIVLRLAAGSIPAALLLLAAMAFFPLNTAALAQSIRSGLVIALPLSAIALVLYPLLARTPEREADGHPANRTLATVLFGVAERVPAQRPGRETEEGEAGDHLDGRGRQDEREHRSQEHGSRVDEQGRDRDREQDRHGPVARGEGERHQLALVAELGEEHNAEGEEECVHARSVR